MEMDLNFLFLSEKQKCLSSNRNNGDQVVGSK